MPSFPLWENFTSGFLDYAMSAYVSLEPWVYPFIFVGVIGFIYASMQSVTVVVVGILFTLGIFAVTTNVFADVPDVTLFLYIVSIIGISLLITALFIKRRN